VTSSELSPAKIKSDQPVFLSVFPTEKRREVTKTEASKERLALPKWDPTLFREGTSFLRKLNGVFSIKKGGYRQGSVLDIRRKKG